MAKIVTLKNNNDEDVYPITTAEAVNGGLYADNGIEVTGVIPDVTTSRIADGAVTSDKVDWTTLPHQVIDADNTPLQLTCTKAGTYYVFGQMSWNGSATKVCTLKKNGTTSLAEGVDSRGSGGDWGQIVCQAIVSLAVGDRVAYYDSGSSTIITGGNYKRNAIGMICIGN